MWKMIILLFIWYVFCYLYITVWFWSLFSQENAMWESKGRSSAKLSSKIVFSRTKATCTWLSVKYNFTERINVKQTWPTTVILPALRTMEHCTGTTNGVQNTSCFSISWHLGACWFNLSALNWILKIEKCKLPSCYKAKHIHNLFCSLPLPVRVSLWQTSWFGPLSVCYPWL